MNKDSEKNNTNILANDRIKEYLIPYLDEFIFDELTEEYLTKIGMSDILGGVPVPFKKTELNDLSGINMARAMAMVIGCDPVFKHAEAYKVFIKRAFGGDFVTPLLAEGVGLANGEKFERACICFRGAICLEPANSDAVYSYARACRDCYTAGEGEEYVGRFKAESLEAFERLTLMVPDFEMGYYYLGYGYLNLGLYTKARLTFKTFMEVTDEGHFDKAASEILALRKDMSKEELSEEWNKLRAEVGEWIDKLEEPVRIEEAYNHVLAGRYEEGIAGLEPYCDNEAYNTWWPLYYYLGVAYEQIGSDEKAMDSYRKVLEFSPSNIEAMECIIRIGERRGDSELAEKYREKIKIVNRNREEERAASNPGYN